MIDEIDDPQSGWGGGDPDDLPTDTQLEGDPLDIGGDPSDLENYSPLDPPLGAGIDGIAELQGDGSQDPVSNPDYEPPE